MARIQIGGDPESYMEAPQMSVGGDGAGGPSFIASLLDLIGIHRQVAKGPKPTREQEVQATQPQQVVPQVLTDVESVLSPQETPILPVTDNAPMTTWGQAWIQSLRPLTTIDPNTGR